MEFFTGLLHSQFLVTPRLPTKSFTSQTVIVTGSNTGLGFEAAKHVAKLGASLLILAVRTVSKGESAKAAILAATKQPSSSIEVWELDMNSYDSVKAFAKRASKLERLDVVLENAGIMSNHFKVVEGYEVVITTNVISTFLLALLLLPKLKESSEKFNIKPRLTIVASDMHILAKFKERNAEDIFAALNDENSFDASDRYPTSKLIEILCVRALSSLLTTAPKSAFPGIIVNCLTPGFCRSNFNSESGGVMSDIFMKVVTFFMARTTEVGSRTLVAAISGGEETHGAYMADGEIMDPSLWVRSSEGEAVQEKVWEQLLQQLNKISPGISENI